MQTSSSREDQLLSKLQNFMARQSKQPRDRGHSPINTQSYRPIGQNQKLSMANQTICGYQRQRRTSFRNQESRQAPREQYQTATYQRVQQVQKESTKNHFPKFNYQSEREPNTGYELKAFSSLKIDGKDNDIQPHIPYEINYQKPTFQNFQFRDYDLTPPKKQYKPQRPTQYQTNPRQFDQNLRDKTKSVKNAYSYREQPARQNTQNVQNTQNTQNPRNHQNHQNHQNPLTPLNQYKVQNYEHTNADQIKSKPQYQNYESLRRKYLAKPMPNLPKENTNITVNYSIFPKQNPNGQTKFYEEMLSPVVDQSSNRRNRLFSYNVDEPSQEKKFTYKIDQHKQVKKKCQNESNAENKKKAEERRPASCHKISDVAIPRQHRRIPHQQAIMKTPPKNQKQCKLNKRGQIGSIFKCSSKTPQREKQQEEQKVTWQANVISQINKVKDQIKKQMSFSQQNEETLQKLNKIKQMNARINGKIMNILNSYGRS